MSCSRKNYPKDWLPTQIYDIYDDYFDRNLFKILQMNKSYRTKQY